MSISSANYLPNEEQEKIKKLNWYEWSRYSKKIYANELTELSSDQLIELEEDMRVTIVSCSSHIEELVFAIRACTEHQLTHRSTLMLEKRRAVAVKIKTENFLTSVRQEIYSRSSNSNKKNTKPLVIKLKGSEMQDLHSVLNSAYNKFKYAAFFDMLKLWIGEDSVDALMRKSEIDIINQFLHWAETSDQVTTEQAVFMLESQSKGINKAYAKKGYNSVQDFILTNLPNNYATTVEPTELW
jgi:hypothetical protein